MSVTQATFAATLVDEWVRGGVTDAVVCPGSRSTPLAVALAARAELRLHVRLDERGAGFFAVGLALATGRPPVVCTTSGTASVELHPAVVEAHHGRVPLLVCTADRPPELHGVGAPQTVDQVGLFGLAVRWAADPGVPDPATGTTWRPLAGRALAEAQHGPAGPGPVHLNLAFRDPLVGEAGALPPRGPVARVAERPHADGAAVAATVRRWQRVPGVVMAGAGAGRPERVLALAGRLGWPVLADPRSGCRRLEPQVVGAADALLRDAAVADALRPEAVLLLGAPWASKVVAAWLARAAAAGADVVAVDPWWRWADPDRIVSVVHPVDPDAWLTAALAATEGGEAASGGPADGGWAGRWRAVEGAAQKAIDGALAGGLSEPALARRLYGLLPAGTAVVASSSMPVRDLEWYAPPTAAPPRVLANRGANGIDGVGATALGVAAAGQGPVVGVLGDLAFLHDVSSLVRPAGSARARCTLVVADNGGGGIFDFLPQAAALSRERFELLFGTPMAPDVAAVARGFGAEVVDTADLGEVGTGIAAGADVVRVRMPGRPDNVAVHDRVHRAVAAAAGEALHGD